MFEPKDIKKDFPIFQHHPKLVYLDSTASTLKPRAVIEAERKYYEEYGVNVHRGIYALSMTATEAYEGAREKIRKFINAKSTKEIVFVRGTTEGINLVASSFGSQLVSGDVILLSEMEHHANIVPWQRLASPRSPGDRLPLLEPEPHSASSSWPRSRSRGQAGGRTTPAATPPITAVGGTPPGAVAAGGVELRWIPVTDDGQLDLTNIDELLKGVKLVAVTQMSNVLGVVNDVKFLAAKAHAAGAKILVDAAQSVPHMPVDVQGLDCDFLAFSGHKMLGPTGIGVLYAKEEILATMEPYQRGGDMILEVTKEKAVWNELPYKFEAGTPNIAGAIGLGAAVDYLTALGMENVWAHDQELATYGLEQLAKLEDVKVLGATGRGAIFAMDLPGIHPHDIGSILDEQNIAVRAGHHCTQPLHAKFGLTATTRASGYVYTTKEDIDAFIDGLKKVKDIFA